MILNSIIHTARRSHLCASCGRTVHTGEQYVRAQMPGGGRAARRAFHTRCYDALTRSTERTGGANVGNIS